MRRRPTSICLRLLLVIASAWVGSIEASPTGIEILLAKPVRGPLDYAYTFPSTWLVDTEYVGPVRVEVPVVFLPVAEWDGVARNHMMMSLDGHEFRVLEVLAGHPVGSKVHVRTDRAFVPGQPVLMTVRTAQEPAHASAGFLRAVDVWTSDLSGVFVSSTGRALTLAEDGRLTSVESPQDAVEVVSLVESFPRSDGTTWADVRRDGGRARPHEGLIQPYAEAISRVRGAPGRGVWFDENRNP